MQRLTLIERRDERCKMNNTLVASSVRPLPSSFDQRSLVVASLDIGRVLADRNGVTFRAKGTSMYPTIRAGDVLRIQSRAATDVSVGDIAVCRRPKYLFSHRVIGKGLEEGRAYIVTRPDRFRQGWDELTFDENLLGVIVTITRNGKPVPLQPTVYPLPVRCYYRMRVAFINVAERWQIWVTAVFARLAHSKFYQFVARTWFVPARPLLRYTVSVPLNPTLGDGVYRRFDPDAFDLRMQWKGRRIDRWTLMLHLNGAREPVARVTFARSAHAIDVWRVAESHVHLRYRGAGLDDALFRKAQTVFARCGK